MFNRNRDSPMYTNSLLILIVAIKCSNRNRDSLMYTNSSLTVASVCHWKPYSPGLSDFFHTHTHKMSKYKIRSVSPALSVSDCFVWISVFDTLSEYLHSFPLGWVNCITFCFLHEVIFSLSSQFPTVFKYIALFYFKWNLKEAASQNAFFDKR